MLCCSSIRKIGIIAIAAALLMSIQGRNAHAAALGHWYPAIYNNRDYFVPTKPGFYYAQYSPYYNSDTFHDRNGNKKNFVVIDPPGPGSVNFNFDANLHMIVLAPVLMWATPWEILGARYAAYIAPTMANSNLSADFTNQTLGGTSLNTTNYAWGDTYIQPIWLDWSFKHWDISFAEGFYAPTGKYNTTNVSILGNNFVVPSAGNVGLGFWTNQVQPAVAWYPFDNQGTAVTSTLTWEVNSKMSGISLTPGQRITWNWGATQYLPVTKDQSRLVEVGVLGYSQWQVTDDTGIESNNNAKDQIHAIGGQLGYAIVPSMFQINFKYMHEYNAEDRFQGDWFNLSFVVKAF